MMINGIIYLVVVLITLLMPPERSGERRESYMHASSLHAVCISY